MLIHQKRFTENILALYGKQGAKWLSELPEIVKEIAAKWSLRVENPFPGLSFHYVAPCLCQNENPAVLKIGFVCENSTIFNEQNALQRFDGKGAVKLLRFEENLNALLLERLSPGESLKIVCLRNDELATEIAIKVMQRLWRQTPPQNEFPTLESWTSGLQKAEKSNFAPFFFRKARDYFDELIGSSPKQSLLHGDFHHENILSAKEKLFWRLIRKESSATSVLKQAFFSIIREAGFYRIRIGKRFRRNASECLPRHLKSNRKCCESGLLPKRYFRLGGLLKTAGKIGKNGWLAPKFGKIKGKRMTNNDFGMIGLGTMGRNFLLNVADNGFSCVGYDLDSAKRELLLDEGNGKTVETANDIAEFVQKLAKPRKIMLLVPAGKIVDSVIQDLLPHLEAGDLIIDGGNSHFTDTERREAVLTDKNVDFMGVGVSGGEEGARHGASIMPGGSQKSFERVRLILETVAAKVNGEPCVAYMGSGSAGHFVKMVHNGIEYGLMQLLAETYDLMKRSLGMSYEEMSQTFAEWNAGALNSFLVEITAAVLRKKDEKTGALLVEMILDKAGQKGTGKWTSQAAMDFGIPVPTIDTAVTARQLSALKDERVEASAKYFHQNLVVGTPSPQMAQRMLEALKNAVHSAFIITYAQGFSLLHAASSEKNYNLNLAAIAKIWRGGCIIRSALLEGFRQAFEENPDLTNLLQNEAESRIINQNLNYLREIAMLGISNGIPVAAFASALSYFDAYTSRRLPANLIQAQRDYFGAHTYQRVDETGVFHTPDWV